jgi:hypothetical protein
MLVILATQEAEIKDRVSKPAWGNSSIDPVLKIRNMKIGLMK